MTLEQGFDFDDVLVVPRYSNVNSRDEVDISVDLKGKFKLQFPVIASPMRGIVNAEFCIKLAELGGIGILHRFHGSYMDWMEEIEKISEAKLFGLAVGLRDSNYIEFLKYKPNILCVDVANGGTQTLIDFCKQVKKYILERSPDTLLMSGNVATYNTFQNLIDAGVDLVRVGLGGGALCSTRNVTGIGVPQMSAIADCSKSNGILVADGGIRNSGDAVKCFASGADVLMIGALFGQTYESPSQDTIYGMASKRLQQDEMHFTAVKSIEGIEKAVEKKMSLKEFVDEFSWGIRSAGTYLNAKNIEQIRTNSKFILSGKGSIKQL